MCVTSVHFCVFLSVVLQHSSCMKHSICFLHELFGPSYIEIYRKVVHKHFFNFTFIHRLALSKWLLYSIFNIRGKGNRMAVFRQNKIVKTYMNVFNVYNELTIGNRSPFNSRVLENYYFQASTQEAAYIFMYVIFNSRQLKKRRSY